MRPSEIKALVNLHGKCGYNAENKAQFRRLSMKLMRELRAQLGMHNAEVRFNAGGIAVSGDATMHADTVYISMNVDGFSSINGILYRTCKGQRDYTGGANRWYSWQRLQQNGVEGLAQTVREMR